MNMELRKPHNCVFEDLILFALDYSAGTESGTVNRLSDCYVYTNTKCKCYVLQSKFELSDNVFGIICFKRTTRISMIKFIRLNVYYTRL